MVFSSGPAAPVPLALWPCAQPPEPPHQPSDTDPPSGIPLPLAERLLTEYTAPGDLVIDAALTPNPTTSTLHKSTIRLHRRLAPFHAYQVPANPPARGAARLLVAAGPRTDDGLTVPSQLVMRSARWLLSPGGLLAVVLTHTERHPGGEPDPITRTVGLAADAGLGYLQHVIALLVPIRRSHLALPPRSDLPLTPEANQPATRAHLPAHADVLVFATPEVTEPQTVTEVARA